MSTVTAVPLQPVKRRVLVYLWLGIALAVIAAVALAMQAPRDPAAVALAKVAKSDAAIKRTPSGLLYKVMSPGTGDAHPTDDDIALILYDGRLLNGTQFDASQQPTPMPVVASDPARGRAGVVPGFSEALKLMTKGAKYRIWIPPALAYGDKDQKDQTGRVVIPAHAPLMFDLTLLDWKSEAEIRQAQAIQQMMMQQQQQQQGGGAGGAGAAGNSAQQAVPQGR